MALVYTSLNKCFLGASESTPQSAYRSVQPYLRNSRHSVVILYNGPPIPPQNFPFPWGDLNLHLVHALSAHSSPWSKGISIGSAVSARLTSVTDGRTDHATRSVTVDRIHVRSIAMRAENQKSFYKMSYI